MRVTNESEMHAAAKAIVGMGANAVLLKGGHVAGGDHGTVTDLLYGRDEIITFSHPRIDTTSTHGTGCTLSAAIAANLALDMPLRDAVASATDFVHEAIANAPGLGSGHGPLNHFAGSEATNSRTRA
jgi:hydroxymethylpyrimidine/phosphomethylpyrimidine kinase